MNVQMKPAKIIAIVGLSLGAIAGLFVIGLLWSFSRDLPLLTSLKDYRPAVVTRVVANGGNGKDKREVAIGEFFRERRYVVPIEKIPSVVVQAFISAEDEAFFEHSGINLVSMLRASIANFRAGHFVQGGSTITQQVTKSLLLTPERSLDRKIKEVILASRIEKNLSKQQILHLYLNQIYLGRGAYGVQAASRVYFNKDISELTLAEAALLGGMPQAPGKYSPHLNPKKAKERQLYVLRRMYESGHISQAQMVEAAAQPVRIFEERETNTQYAPYLVEHIRRYLLEKFGEKAVLEQGLTVYVPTSAELCATASKSLREGLEAVDKRIGYRGPLLTLKKQGEIDEFLKESRSALFAKSVGFQVFTPDGRLDPIEALKLAGLKSESELLKVGEKYQAVVASVDDKAKVATAMVGTLKVLLPIEKMRWAHWAKDLPRAGGEPRVPSMVLARGDVVWVKIAEVGTKGILAALEQEPQVQGALFSMEAATGYVLAMEGGYDFDKSEFNRAIQAARQPGSAFKPIIYSAALEKGYTPASIIVDSPIVYEDAESGKWKPANFEEKFYGDTTFRQALIKSRNVPTIKIVQSIQVPYVIDYAKRLGMNAQFSPDLSISLGSASVSLVELTKTYSLFARLGRRVTPIFYTQIVDRDGNTLEEQKPQVLPAVVNIPQAKPNAAPNSVPSPVTSLGVSSTAASGFAQGLVPIPMPSYPPANDPDQVLDPRVAYVMTTLMKEVVNYGTGHQAKSLNRATAGKTGTTNEYIDAWFIGFTPTVVTGAWVGFDNLKTIGPLETGAKSALPIWLGYMQEAVKAYPESDFTVPPGVAFASIDANTGKAAAPNSSGAIVEAFIEGTQPTGTPETGKGKNGTPTDFFKEDIE